MFFERKVGILLVGVIVCLTVAISPVSGAPPQQEIRVLRGHEGAVFAVDWSPDGQQIASAGEGGIVHIWNANNGNEDTTLEHGGDMVWALAWSPNGQYLAFGGSGYRPGVETQFDTINIWRKVSSSNFSSMASETPEYGRAISGIAWAGNSQRIVLVGRYPNLTFLDLNGDTVMTALSGHGYWIQGMDWSSASNQIATGGGGHIQSDYMVLVRSLGDLDNQITFPGHSADVWDVSWNDSGDLLASASQDGTVRVWNVPRQQLDSVLQGPGEGILAVAWSPDGEWIAGGTERGTIRVWNYRTGEQIDFTGHSANITDIAWSPDSTKFASASRDVTVRLWSIEGGGTTARPDPVDAVRAYYDLVESNDLDTAWAMLTDHFINKHNAGTQGHNDYIDWWRSVREVEISTIFVDREGGNEAIVFARLTYHTSTDALGPYDTYLLLKYVEGRGWMIDDAASDPNSLDTGL